MTEIFSPQNLTALFQVVMIDLVLAGDNAIVIGLAAAGLPADQRSKAILAGIAAATILRIVFASITVQLLQVIGLLLAGGILLLWVCWKMWRELRTSPEHHQKIAEVMSDDGDINAGSKTCERPRKTLGEAIWQITIADVSMSLDNVLAVAGAARETPAYPDIRFGTIDRLDGVRRQLHRKLAAEASLDRLCRPGDHPLCSIRHVLPRAQRRSGGTATFKSALIGIGESAPIRDR